jgi:hypothetical protein
MTLKQKLVFGFISACGGAVATGAVYSFPHSPVLLALVFAGYSVVIYKVITKDIKPEGGK